MFQDVKIGVRILTLLETGLMLNIPQYTGHPPPPETCWPKLSVFRLINTQSMTTPYLKCKSYTSCSLPPIPNSIGKIVLQEDSHVDAPPDDGRGPSLAEVLALGCQAASAVVVPSLPCTKPE